MRSAPRWQLSHTGLQQVTQAHWDSVIHPRKGQFMQRTSFNFSWNFLTKTLHTRHTDIPIGIHSHIFSRSLHRIISPRYLLVSQDERSFSPPHQSLTESVPHLVLQVVLSSTWANVIFPVNLELITVSRQILNFPVSFIIRETSGNEGRLESINWWQLIWAINLCLQHTQGHPVAS